MSPNDKKGQIVGHHPNRKKSRRGKRAGRPYWQRLQQKQRRLHSQLYWLHFVFFNAGILERLQTYIGLRSTMALRCSHRRINKTATHSYLESPPPCKDIVSIKKEDFFLFPVTSEMSIGKIISVSFHID